MTVISRKGRSVKYNQLSVLVVDDQPFYRNLMNEIMRVLGVPIVSFAVDGFDALDAMENAIPDVIFLDWVMPDMDGIEFTTKVRSMRNEVARMTPIIMVTSNNKKSQIEQAVNCGVDTFILKPLAIQSIIARIKEVIERPRDFVVTDTYIGPCRRRNKAAAGQYFGKYRRYDDPMELTQGGVAEKRAKQYLKGLTSGLNSSLAALYTNDPSALEELHKTAQKVLGIAGQIGDTHLSKVCWSVITYMEKFGRTPRMRPDIVATHFQSMEALINTPSSEVLVRDEVVKGLNKVVMQAIQSIKVA